MSNIAIPSFESLMRYARRLNIQEIHTIDDPESDLKAIISIHNTKAGSAIGGVRLQIYPHLNNAIHDVLRLSYMMALKSSITNLPHGGAKAVIMAPSKETMNRKKIFTRFAKLVNELQGKYITSLDAGTTIDDMNIIANHSNYVVGSTIKGNPINPSIYTAQGILKGIEASAAYRLKKDSLTGVKIAIQGAGHVAYILMQSLIERGAIVSCCDINQKKLQQIKDNMPNVHIVDPEKIYEQDCDIFVPCALGGIINQSTIPKLRAKIIVGAANNQLNHASIADVLHKKSILYAPDFLVNSGGLISASDAYLGNTIEDTTKKIDAMQTTLIELFKRSEQQDLPTTTIATQIALEKLQEQI